MVAIQLVFIISNFFQYYPPRWVGFGFSASECVGGACQDPPFNRLLCAAVPVTQRSEQRSSVSSFIKG